MRVDGVLRLSGCRVPGRIRLGGARLSGTFLLDRARLGHEGASEEVLHLNHSVLEDDVLGPGMTADGEIRLNGASVAGQVDLTGAVVRNPGGRAVDAENLSVGSDVNATRARFEGRSASAARRSPGCWCSRRRPCPIRAGAPCARPAPRSGSSGSARRGWTGR